MDFVVTAHLHARRHGYFSVKLSPAFKPFKLRCSSMSHSSFKDIKLLLFSLSIIPSFNVIFCSKGMGSNKNAAA